jgi:hypothetical protein
MRRPDAPDPRSGTRYIVTIRSLLRCVQMVDRWRWSPVYAVRRLCAVLAVLLAAGACASGSGGSQASKTGDSSGSGAGTALGCTVFPADNVWHADVSGLPVHSRSGDWLSSMGGAEQLLQADFGPSYGEQPIPYGIPFDVVDGSQPKVEVDFSSGAPQESDAGPYPFGGETQIEGGPDATGDRHAVMIDRDECVLYELYDARWNGGEPTAFSGAVFDLNSNDLRTDGWTSADAAGLPIFPGLIRREEVEAGEVDHAIRFTAEETDQSYLWPARHQAGARSDPTLPPMGAWFRLKEDYDISGFRPDTQVILQAMKQHGMILADNGSNWFFTGAAEGGWDTDMLSELNTIPAREFEAVDTSSLMVSPDSGQVSE